MALRRMTSTGVKQHMAAITVPMMPVRSSGIAHRFGPQFANIVRVISNSQCGADTAIANEAVATIVSTRASGRGRSGRRRICSHAQTTTNPTTNWMGVR